MRMHIFLLQQDLHYSLLSRYGWFLGEILAGFNLLVELDVWYNDCFLVPVHVCLLLNECSIDLIWSLYLLLCIDLGAGSCGLGISRLDLMKEAISLVCGGTLGGHSVALLCYLVVPYLLLHIFGICYEIFCCSILRICYKVFLFIQVSKMVSRLAAFLLCCWCEISQASLLVAFHCAAYMWTTCLCMLVMHGQVLM
jgi:hypothetical protein